MSEHTERPFTAASFNQFLDEEKLMGSRCTECGGLYLPPRALCPQCHSENLAWVEMNGQGKLAAFTSIYIAPTAMNDLGFGRSNPYLTGIVELNEGVQISARLLGLDAQKPEEIQIGTPMQVTFLRQGEDEDQITTLAFQPQTN
jgi:uncharacterized OB-fold protein